MGFINFRGGLKNDNYDELSDEAKKIEEDEKNNPRSLRNRRLAADYFGVTEYAIKENKAILAELLLRHRNLLEIYHTLSNDNVLFSDFDSEQFINDFWLNSFTEIINQGKITDIQEIKCLQILIMAFKINNKTSAKDHFVFYQKNPQYKEYMQRCFGLKNENIPLVWMWFIQMGYKELIDEGKHEKNRMDIVVHFMNEYIYFMMLLSFYISQMFPGNGCGKDIRILLLNSFDRIGSYMSENRGIELNVSSILNPVYSDVSDSIDAYERYEQTERQTEGLRSALNALRNKFGKPKRVLRLVQLLDMCSESDSKILENEYNRITQRL